MKLIDANEDKKQYFPRNPALLQTGWKSTVSTIRRRESEGNISDEDILCCQLRELAAFGYHFVSASLYTSKIMEPEEPAAWLLEKVLTKRYSPLAYRACGMVLRYENEEGTAIFLHVMNDEVSPFPCFCTLSKEEHLAPKEGWILLKAGRDIIKPKMLEPDSASRRKAIENCGLYDPYGDGHYFHLAALRTGDKARDVKKQEAQRIFGELKELYFTGRLTEDAAERLLDGLEDDWRIRLEGGRPPVRDLMLYWLYAWAADRDDEKTADFALERMECGSFILCAPACIWEATTGTTYGRRCAPITESEKYLDKMFDRFGLCGNGWGCLDEEGLPDHYLAISWGNEPLVRYFLK